MDTRLHNLSIATSMLVISILASTISLIFIVPVYTEIFSNGYWD